ncbi:hypothetical protein [Labrys sp. WJW]|uniref:hypothetical protein n=1 Tax=Labrys sp. WJW TaxID=1737983 RepID=UPI0012EAEE72|nr:hypothetical protein [Labrys sp. WJW]
MQLQALYQKMIKFDHLFKDNKNAVETVEGDIVVKTLAYPPETHLEQYLSYYVGTTNPGYAVLIDGDWGTGKTFQVTKALPADHAWYVSLFGLSTPADIEAQVFSKMFSTKAKIKGFVSKLNSINLGLTGLGSVGINGLPSAIADAFVKGAVDNSRPLIFDDLERCSVEPENILGIINRYVEHHGCRVIVIAHDDKVVQKIKDTKEKIFGQTLKVEPNIDAAFRAFNEHFTYIDNEDLLGELKEEVLSIFKESKAHSLRVLRHVVEDVRRLRKTLEPRHLENHLAMVELVRLFSALSIEVRDNVLNRADIRDRKAAIFRYEVDTSGNREIEDNRPQIVKSKSKYKSIDISNTILDDQVIEETLFEGRFVNDHIRNSIDSSPHFVKIETTPPWKIVINFDNLDDDIVSTAIQAMNEQFLNRSITESGEFLHVVALKMMMSTRGISVQSIDDIEREAKLYIDDLLSANLLPSRSLDYRWDEAFRDSHDRIRYWIEEGFTYQFQRVRDYLIAGRTKALENSFPTLIVKLLEIVRKDGQSFFANICYTRDGVTAYQDVPILSQVSEKDFVDAWLASPKTGWYWITSALQERIQSIDHKPALGAEIESISKFVSELRKRADSSDGLARLRLERCYQPILSELESRQRVPRN